jgi:hypothetical protein
LEPAAVAVWSKRRALFTVPKPWGPCPFFRSRKSFHAPPQRPHRLAHESTQLYQGDPLFLESAVTALVALTSLTGIAAPSAANPSVAHAPASVVLGQPLAAAHAHNDYEHDRPLFDALEHGFTSVEADVWLVDGELRVAHDLEDAKPGVTLESLYLDPLDGWCGTRATAFIPIGTAACSF